MLLLIVVVSVAFAWILLPFYGAVLWGTVFAVMFSPMHQWLSRALGGKPALAAAVTILIVVVMLILPLIFLAVSLTRELAALYGMVQTGEFSIARYLQTMFEALPGWMMELLGRIGLPDFQALQERASVLLMRGYQLLGRRVFGIGQNMLSFIVSLFVMLYLLFFLLRDGPSLTTRITDAIPLRPDRLQALVSRFAMVIRATVKSNLVVALLQGTFGALIFFFLDIRAPLLWGALMAVFSLLPVVGPILVWLPVAVYLLTSGFVWHGIALFVYGMVVIGLVDNIVRPLMVGKDANMPDYLVLISTLGGITIFGIHGFIVGPLIAAMFIAAWDSFVPGLREREGAGQTADAASSSAPDRATLHVH